MISDIYSNSPTHGVKQIADLKKSEFNTLVDMGEDEFTVGRPHPMIDFSLRNERILQEAQDEETGVILLDVVLGYGANLNPEKELVPTIKTAFKIAKVDLIIVCSITGTEDDPQNKNLLEKQLESEGVLVMPSNAAAAEIAGKIILGGK